MILFSRVSVSRFLLPAVSTPQTENTRSTYAAFLKFKSLQKGKKNVTYSETDEIIFQQFFGENN